MSQGLFLTLEGVDGAGKSTHVQWIAEFLRAAGQDVLVTREPGGTPLGERLRDYVLTESMSLRTETLLMFAARCEHIEQVIAPALAAGRWVLCDRFTDATYAYQGGGRELGEAPIATLEQWVHAGLQPDRTWLFDVPLEVAQARRSKARKPDRFESEADAFFVRTQAMYRHRAAQDKKRFYVVDATQTIEEIREWLAIDLSALIEKARQ